MFSAGVWRMWKCMSITGEGQCGTSCANADLAALAAAIPPRKIRLSISMNPR
jgi:hypothetical protein